MIKIDDSEVLIFSDFHWGKGRDSTMKLESNDKYIDWMISECIKNKIKTIIFMGDWFDCRSSISVKTYDHSFKALKKLKDNDLKIYLFVGNHDAYFKDTIEVNSLSPLDQMDNVIVVDDTEDVEFASGKTAGFLPWDCFDYETLKHKEWDVMFGHFEFMGAQLNAVGSMACKHGYNGNDMTKVSPLVFSGHFHARKEYNYKAGKVITVGCPLELDWGDYNNPKGYYILNTSTLEYSFTENTVSPRHYKVFWSEIKSGKEEFKNVKDNYIKLIVDCEYKFEEVMKEVTNINLNGPLKPCEAEFTHNTKFDIFSSSDTDETDTPVHRSKMDFIELFVEKADKEMIKNLDKDNVVALLKQYYTSHDNTE
tara:strand:+ start:1003 stop:2100 length:1098 start_codon:yes stop_codon:yes gene_type:complete